MANGRISVSQEALESALAKFELRIVREIQRNDDKSRERHERLKEEMEGIPEMVRNNRADIEKLKARDWWAGTIATIIAAAVGFMTGQSK